MTRARELAQATHSVLNAYVEVENNVFGGSILRRIIPIPGLFRKIDFSSNDDRLGFLEDRLHRIQEELPSESAGGTSDPLAAVLDDYVDSLLSAVSHLRTICTRLAEKAEGANYSYSEYRSDLEAYNKARSEYIRLGEEVNRVYR